ncbi:hypothetical protein FUA23_09585 [Neolewinella aurantiaca]|uniref:Gingipain domain-containing protein n=1 Tax=Neolewinella aurantiaca TaxID=2602767 RepID=A0A5C7FEW0_9BACT|nr:C25 family cysteine peptidase [Neolewinella aurantiaca]TXF89692.1 hypothetical protein FUA23_09585 [Neolewinella aurantiaca]
MFRTLTTLCLTLLSCSLFAQMVAPDGSISYGNEWIDYGQTHLRIQVATDGMYQVSGAEINAAGLSGDLALHHRGELVPIRVTSDGSIIFYGEKNRGEMDRHLWPDPDANQLNDRYSMHSDTVAYYLTAGTGQYYQQPDVVTPVAATAILRRTEEVFSDEMVKNFFRSGGISIYYSHYDKAEGFGQRSSGDLLSSNGDLESSVTLPLPSANGQQATLDVRFGTAFGSHEVEVSANGNVLATPVQSGWGVIQQQATFNPAGAETTISLKGTAGDQDKPNLAWVAVTYPAQPVYDEELSSFSIPASATATRITLTGLGAAAGALGRITGYAPTTGNMFSAEVDGTGTAVIDFPPSSSDITYQLVVESSDLKAAQTNALSFSSTLPPANTDYLVLTSRRLHGSSVDQLADYRRSVAGGSYQVEVVDVEDLYDEFGYGIPNHPMALRNYLTAAKIAAPNLQYLFIIGKGREYSDIRTTSEMAAAQATFFIPSFGSPASDNLLAAKLGEVTPQLSVGRLAAINDSEVGIYLEKLREVEAQINQGGQSIADRDWQKQIMHLGGGTSAGEQSGIKSRLNTMELGIEASAMAANVTSFFKTSTEPIEDSRQEAIFERINGGTSILTFMGHSSSQTFDFSIDDPANYNNKGRYPFMLSLGCYSGDAFTEERSISERFIFLREKGAVAFAASKGIGYISALGNWGEKLYDNIGNENYGEGLGDVMRNAIEHFSGTSNFTLGILLEQFALSGDPAYRLHPRPGPDFVVDPASVSFTPDVVPAQDETYGMDFRLLNLGTKSEADSMTLRIRQELPSGEIVELKTLRAQIPVYAEVLSVELPNPGIDAVGQNRVFVTLDTDNEVTELPAPAAELNNELETGGQAGVPLTFVANTAKVAFPPRYAVIGGELEFISSTTDVLAPERNYVIQVSSDRKFNTLLTNETIASPGGVIRYRPPFAPTDSTTYYWRISPDSTSTEGSGFIWSESSFTWVADQPENEIGWAMQDQGQTVDGTFDNILADSLEFGWSFSRSITDIKIFNALYSSRDMPRFEYNGQRFGSPHRWYIRAGIQMIVIDSTNSSKWYPNPGNADYNTRPIANSSWDFDTRTASGREGMINFLDEFVPEGAYVMLYSVQRGADIEYVTEDWLADSNTLGTTIYDVLEAEGALQVRGLSEVGSVPYLFSFQKGMGPISEALAETRSDTIQMDASILENWPLGSWRSEAAGPALAWDNLEVSLSPIHLSENDSVLVRVMGTNPEGSEVVLHNQVFNHLSSRSISVDLSGVSEEEFPFLWAELDFFDEEDRNVPTVEHLYFNFSSPGDAAINPAVSISLPDSVDQGQELVINAGYENISRIGMDSLLVELSVVDATNNISTFTQRKGPLPPGATDQFSFSLPSVDFSQDFRYSVTLNPNQDQPENVTFNNVLNSRVKVGTDLIDPEMQIFFDGIRINNGDLVSAKPEIHIVLRDENQYLALNDTGAYFLQLTHPGDLENGLSSYQERISFSDSRVEFLPATTDNNSAEIFFRPSLSRDGNYTIEVVGQDRSSNFSGALSLQQDFEVINEQMVANVLTYPNPFTTQTRFVYTLTGNEVPEVFRIQIMTVSGRVVRDIDLAASELLKIGTHQSQFAWDGTDEYGDLLANGVYLYRVITSDESGNTLEKYDTGTDQYFAREIGKVVILR